MKTLIAAYSGVLRGTGSSILSALQDLFSVTWLNRSKVEKQLQVISVLQWVLSFLVLGVACSVILMYTFCTDCWLIAVLYFTWLVFDWNTPKKGGRRSQWVRNWAVWRYFRDYFPIQLVKTHNLLTSRNYIFGYHPHGIMGLGAFCNFSTEATEVSKKFPGIRPYLATLAGNFRMPVLREYLMSGGICPVNRDTIDYLLSKNGSGNAIIIVVGGAAESLSSMPGKNAVTLRNRKGFVKLALRHGADLVPTYSFGENEVYKQVIFEEGSWGRWVQKKFQKYIGFAPCIFHGRGLFSSDTWGLVPYSKPITTVVGEPITIPRLERPTQQDIDLYHAMYVQALVKLFDQHKTKFGLPETEVLERRLRHLRNIAARNIVNRNGHQLLDTYFTLHLCNTEKVYKEFYRSEVIKNSLNPTWRSLDFGIMPDRLDTSVSCFVVKIWGGKEDVYQLLIEWKVCLDGLKYLGQQIHARNQNEIIFGLNDGYYGAPFEHKGYSNAQKNILLQVDQNCVRNSYDVFSLLRLHRAQCAIKQTQVTVQKIGKEIEEKLRLTSTSNGLKKESECLQLKILVLRNELERQKKALGREVVLLHKEQIALQDKGSTFSAEHLKLQLQKESLNELRKECTAKRELFLKTNAQLTIRCRQLLSELSYIYPIDLNEHKDYFVCGVKLPNSEDFQAKDDGSIAVALGYTAHLVSMISFFLQVPLRYPVIHKGSRSTIKDNINDKLTEKEREFPLYPKGGEKLQFDYGVYLLNKNIAQLRYQHGLGTPDLRQTLPNLKNFMEHGLMVRCDRHHTSSAIPVPKRQSSIFGGADVGFSGGIPSPDKGYRKRASSENERLQYKTPPPSYNSALVQPVTPVPSTGESDRKTASLSSSLDTSLDLSKENKKKGVDLGDSLNGSHVSVNTSQEQGQALSGPPATINGTLLPGEQASSSGAQLPGSFHPVSEAELCCTVEQAEEIIGMEATGFTSGDQLEAFNCIPVDSAVAVECDEQVLGEFEEFSRRIYALNENVSSFRRPRRSSDK